MTTDKVILGGVYDFDNNYWQRKGTPTSLPEFIEGKAKGYLKMIEGEVFEKSVWDILSVVKAKEA